MNIKLNGEPHSSESPTTVRSLLDELEIREKRVAVMINDKIVKKADFEERQIEEGDAVEVIHMVGGG